jgi:sensor histidine kinase regulating citrate/malate metabolism
MINPWMRNRGIRTRVLMLALLPLLLVATGLSWYFIASAYAEMEDALERHALERANQLAKACEYSLFSGNQSELTLLVTPVARETGVQSVAIVDPVGRAIISLGSERLLSQWQGRATGLIGRNKEAILVVAPVMQRILAIDGLATDSGADVATASLGYVALEVSRRATLKQQRTILLTGVVDHCCWV